MTIIAILQESSLLPHTVNGDWVVGLNICAHRFCDVVCEFDWKGPTLLGGLPPHEDFNASEDDEEGPLQWYVFVCFHTLFVGLGSQLQ